MPAIREKTGRFAKGISGNPSGRKPIPKEVKEILEAATPDAVRLLINTFNDEQADMKLRIDCANSVIDRSLGKAKQSVDVDADLTVRMPTIQIIK